MDESGGQGVELAVLDYQCRSQVHLEEVRSSVHGELATAWMEGNPGAVESVNSTKARLIDNATEVLS